MESTTVKIKSQFTLQISFNQHGGGRKERKKKETKLHKQEPRIRPPVHFDFKKPTDYKHIQFFLKIINITTKCIIYFFKFQCI